MPNGAIMACCCMKAAAIGLNPNPKGAAIVGAAAANGPTAMAGAATGAAFFAFFGTTEAFFLERFAGFAAGLESATAVAPPSAFARLISESTVGLMYACWLCNDVWRKAAATSAEDTVGSFASRVATNARIMCGVLRPTTPASSQSAGKRDATVLTPIGRLMLKKNLR